MLYRARAAIHGFTEQACQAGAFQDQFLGYEATAGFKFMDVLGRKYSVVAANPPYMGSGNAGTILKKHIDQNFKTGKRDLYAAFILRSCELAEPGARVAMVTQQSWMFLRSFAELRAIPEDDDGDVPKVGFRGLLRETTIETLAHLGPHAFGEISGEVVSVVIFVLKNGIAPSGSRICAFRLVGVDSADGKSRALATSIAEPSHTLRFTTLQTTLLGLPGCPVVYWLPREIAQWIPSAARLSQVAIASDGVTGLSRLTRYVWEVIIGVRWFAYSKGGSHVRWAGMELHSTDWEHDGARTART